MREHEYHHCYVTEKTIPIADCSLFVKGLPAVPDKLHFSSEEIKFLANGTRRRCWPRKERKLTSTKAVLLRPPP